MTSDGHAEIVICGAGIAGIATAHALAVRHGQSDILLLDPRPPMSLTSAASGENYRNWWPHARLIEFASRSIDLMEELAGHDEPNFRIDRHGYAYVTRAGDVPGLIDDLHEHYGQLGVGDIRVHENDDELQDARDGADVLLNRDALRARFPHFCDSVRAVVLVRRAGNVDSQQLGQHMLNEAKARGVRLIKGELKGVTFRANGLSLEAETTDGPVAVETEVFVNAAGPFAKKVAAMFGADLPLECIFQQKIAFDDYLGMLPRGAPFTIDLDTGPLDCPLRRASYLRKTRTPRG